MVDLDKFIAGIGFGVLIASPYAVALFSIWLAHKMFNDSIRHFLDAVLSELKDFSKLKPTVGAINFLGVIVAAILLFVFLAMGLVHVIDPSTSTEAHENPLYRHGLYAVVLVCFFVFIVLSAKVTKSGQR